jgi:predicted nucleic acid-binding protein
MENQIVLVDTSILITHFKKGSNKFEYFCQLQDERKLTLAVSVITVFEYYSGVVFNDITSLRKADSLFEALVIYDVDRHIAKTAAKINSQLKLYQRIDLADILIGSTALYYDIPLFTDNKKHFKLVPNLKFA